jgi:hypothetical protein
VPCINRPQSILGALRRRRSRCVRARVCAAHMSYSPGESMGMPTSAYAPQRRGALLGPRSLRPERHGSPWRAAGRRSRRSAPSRGAHPAPRGRSCSRCIARCEPSRASHYSAPAQRRHGTESAGDVTESRHRCDRVLARMWASLGADVGQSRRRWGRVLAQLWLASLEADRAAERSPLRAWLLACSSPSRVATTWPDACLPQSRQRTTPADQAAQKDAHQKLR